MARTMTIVKRVGDFVRRLTGREVSEEKTKKKEKVPLGMKKCPQCDRLILRTAVRCVHCGHFFEPTRQ